MPPRLRSMVLAGLATVLAACGEQPPPPAPPPPEVQVIEAQPQTVALERDFVGRLAPFRSADVRARVAGVLLERTYDEGSDVAEGDVLFRIDPAPLQAQLAAAQAALAQAQANHTNARIAAERGRGLAPKNYISRSDLDNLEAAERSAAAAVQQARASLQSARINLDYATVRAPIAGRAGMQQVTEGALVGQGSATLLTTIEQIDPLYVNFSMSVSELEQLQRAQAEGAVELAGAGRTSVQVVLPDGSAYGERGLVDFSGIVVDPATGSVSLRAQVPNPQQRLLPGTFVTLKVQLGARHDTYVVPQAAVLRDANSAYVLAVNAENLVERRDVTTAAARGGDWLVTEGLAPGTRVIVAGVQKARTGQPANAVPWQPPAPNAAPNAGPAPAGAGATAPPPAPDPQSDDGED